MGKLLVTAHVCVEYFTVAHPTILPGHNPVWLLPPMSEKIPRENWDGFFFDAFAHAGSYLAGLVGGLLLIVKTWKRRGRLVAA